MKTTDAKDKDEYEGSTAELEENFIVRILFFNVCGNLLVKIV